MAQELNGVRVKIARAHEHLEELKRRLRDWQVSKPYPIVVEIDPQTEDQCWKVGGEPVAPGPLPAIGDALYNLRSALDHLAWQLVLRAGGTPTNRTEFPIFNAPDSWKRDSPRKMAGMNEAMQQKIQGLQPCFSNHIYRSEALWALQQHGNTDKHRTLLVVPVSTENMLWQPGGNPTHMHKGPVQKETILARFAKGDHQSNFFAMPNVAFSEAPMLNEDVDLHLGYIAHTIEWITDDFEAQFF